MSESCSSSESQRSDDDYCTLCTSEQSDLNSDDCVAIPDNRFCCCYFFADAVSCAAHSLVCGLRLPPPECPYLVKLNDLYNWTELGWTGGELWPGDVMLVAPIPEYVPDVRLPQKQRNTSGYALVLNIRTRILEPQLWSLASISMTCERLGIGCIGCFDGDMPGARFETLMQILWEALSASTYQATANDLKDDSPADLTDVRRNDLADVVALVMHRRELHLAARTKSSRCITTFE